MLRQLFNTSWDFGRDVWGNLEGKWGERLGEALQIINFHMFALMLLKKIKHFLSFYIAKGLEKFSFIFRPKKLKLEAFWAHCLDFEVFRLNLHIV